MTEDGHFKWATSELLCMYLYLGLNPRPLEFLGECVTHQATVADGLKFKPLGPDSQKFSSLSQISAKILLKSEILVSAEILLKLRFTKGILAETEISDMF